MNAEKFSEAMNEIDDRYVEEAIHYRASASGSLSHYGGKRLRRYGAAAAAVVLLMVSSFSVGALAFAREITVEVPEKQEKVVLEEIGLTLLLPDSWEGKYEVVEGVFEPYDSTMWEFCVKSIYDARTPMDESGTDFYRGTLFTIFQCEDHSISAEEFEQSGIAGIGRYLFATQNATYAILYATDVQFDPENTAHMEEWNGMAQSEEEIQVIIANVFTNES